MQSHVISRDNSPRSSITLDQKGYTDELAAGKDVRLVMGVINEDNLTQRQETEVLKLSSHISLVQVP